MPVNRLHNSNLCAGNAFVKASAGFSEATVLLSGAELLHTGHLLSTEQSSYFSDEVLGKKIVLFNLWRLGKKHGFTPHASSLCKDYKSLKCWKPPEPTYYRQFWCGGAQRWRDRWTAAMRSWEAAVGEIDDVDVEKRKGEKWRNFILF